MSGCSRRYGFFVAGVIEYRSFLTVPPSIFLACFRIPIIPLAFAQQEQVFMRLRTSILHALRHWVRLVPDDVLAQIPTIGLKGEGDSPWDAYQVFMLQTQRPGIVFSPCWTMFLCFPSGQPGG